MPISNRHITSTGRYSRQKYLSELRRYNLTVGEVYTIQSFKRPADKQIGKLIRVTATGYNFYNDLTNSCILDTCIYETKESKDKQSAKRKTFLTPPTFIIERDVK